MMAGKWLAVAVFLCISISCVVGQSVTCEQWCQNGLNFYSKFVQSQSFLQGFFSSCLTQCPGATTSATSTTRTSTTPTTSTSTPTSTTTTTTTTFTTSTTTRPPTTTSPSATSGCGVASYVNRYKIVGGQRAEECEFPWMVGVSVDSNFCGGSIIDNLHIVTAAHCVRDRSTREVISPTRVIIRTGSSYLSNMRAYYVKSVTIDVRHVPGINDYDVAVLTLIEPLVFNNCTAPICLPYSGDDSKYASYCIAAGWGLTSTYDTSLSRNLMKVVLPIVDNSLCIQSYSSQYINDLKICAGDFYYGGVDSCQGDSGGPLMCYENGRFVLHGIVSFGATCAQPRYPGVYTKVANSQILEFIKNNLN
ncbi:transmembrane protease serine 9 [Biomphalaria pfeifferi]|uniref:Transmembrane protease serine 9 n=1 Tax=Biomphalaria pfeifferi TaxID=112525 RepID=A0AAD8FG21_BIOPF|nr:transmembrane protease serine 9 [Biomphalaria pfeifferi]